MIEWIKKILKIHNTVDTSIPADFKQVTGFDTPSELAAYEKGRSDEQKVIIEWIGKWGGKSNSQMGQLLNKKFRELEETPKEY